MDILLRIYNVLFNKMILNSLFPTIIILFIFFLIDFRRIKISLQLNFIILLAALVFFVRIMFSIRGDELISFTIEARRFYPLNLPILILAVLGFPRLIEFTDSVFIKLSGMKAGFLTKYFAFLKKLSIKQIVIIWIVIFGIAGIGKGLSAPSYKTYIQEPGKIIAANTGNGKKSLLIYEYGGHWRTVYYCNADKSININKVLNRNKPKYFYNALNLLKDKGYTPYIFVDNSNKRFEDIFTSKTVVFKLKLIKEWKNGEYSLFKY
jgi:hypothetical protein